MLRRQNPFGHGRLGDTPVPSRANPRSEDLRAGTGRKWGTRTPGKCRRADLSKSKDAGQGAQNPASAQTSTLSPQRPCPCVWPISFGPADTLGHPATRYAPPTPRVRCRLRREGHGRDCASTACLGRTAMTDRIGTNIWRSGTATFPSRSRGRTRVRVS